MHSFLSLCLMLNQFLRRSFILKYLCFYYKCLLLYSASSLQIQIHVKVPYQFSFIQETCKIPSQILTFLIDLMKSKVRSLSSLLFPNLYIFNLVFQTSLSDEICSLFSEIIYIKFHFQTISNFLQCSRMQFIWT